MNKSLFLLILIPEILFGQLLINEICSKGSFNDNYGDNYDWIEFINVSDSIVLMSNYFVSDNSQNYLKWQLPNKYIKPMQKELIVFSGNNIRYQIKNWSALINQYSRWSSFAGYSNPDSNWNLSSFNDSNCTFMQGEINIDNFSDSNITNNFSSIYSRIFFNIYDKEDVNELIFHANYNDAFVAYLNGVEIARSNNINGTPPNYNTLSLNEHNAGLHSSSYEKYIINKEMLNSILNNGENVLSVQIHDSDSISKDLYGQFFLHAGLESELNSYYPQLIWFSEDTSLYHANFKLSKNETITIVDSNQSIIDEYIINTSNFKISEGRYPDGYSDWYLFNELSPGKSNNNSYFYNGFTETPTISLSSGFYKDDQKIIITVSDQEKVYYTLNGDIPDTNDFLYEDTISIHSTSVLSVKSFSSNNLLPSKVIDRTYFINEENHNLPVFSIITDSLNLWDLDSGIYVKGLNSNEEKPFYGANFRQPWSRWSRLEFFDKNMNKEFDEEFDLEIHGGMNRYTPQKSLRFDFKSKYSGDLEYPLISNKSYLNKFNNINLRRELPPSLIKDVFASHIAINTNIDIMGFEPCLLYINGTYWGIYFIREKIDKHYIKSNYSINTDSFDLINGSETNFRVYSGTDKLFFKVYYDIINSNPSSEEFHNLFSQSFDIDNYIDYFIFQTHFSNNDWITNQGNNIKLWRPNSTNGKWRYILVDIDESMKNEKTDMIYQAYNTSLESKHADIFSQFIQNNDFRCKFSNRYHDLLNSILHSDSINLQLNLLIDKIASAIPEHIKRWSYCNNNFYDWNKEIMKISQFYFLRPFYVKSQLKNNLNIPTTTLVKNSNNELSFLKDNNYTNFWFFNNNIIDNLNGSFYYPLKSGNYHVLSIDANGCYSSSNSINIDLSQPKIDIIYPNPTSSILNIKFYNYNTSDYEISITDIMNNVILNEKVLPSDYPIQQSMQYNLDSFKNGIYFVRLESINDMSVKKFIYYK